MGPKILRGNKKGADKGKWEEKKNSQICYLGRYKKKPRSRQLKDWEREVELLKKEGEFFM